MLTEATEDVKGLTPTKLSKDAPLAQLTLNGFFDVDASADDSEYCNCFGTVASCFFLKKNERLLKSMAKQKS